ncbi:cytoplasmic tRNA 2-thiolation protein 1 [Biomphalaria pfeifferi]|uniref:Cytoplasmic tRNA 2-thiolation protein 1 n=1 Tax=Biomphalaria pfeifferi TaxID=112525 RepID=A0AAD8ATB3_BIOPF|nr:cytoplasmic tRNA 2-thiolation protein 1 [Biomphalaria pfeifferi]
MPQKCAICDKKAILKRPKTEDAMCKDCFFWAFEEEIHYTITSANLFTPGETVAIGASGGKDSTVLAHTMKILNERYNYGLNLILLSVDEGITGYRDDSLETVKRNQQQYELPLTIVSYEELYGWTMDAIVKQIGLKNNCTFCGVFRRQALDRGAMKVGANKIVTGHNADDIAETVIMNVLRGDIARLKRCTAIMTGAEGCLPRCKPFKYTYEKEIVMYAYFKKLDYFSTECIYSPNAYRGFARTYIKDLEKIRPSSIIDIIHSGECLSVKTEVKMPTQTVCQRCNFVSSNDICKACVMLEGLNKGRPRLGIGKINKERRKWEEELKLKKRSSPEETDKSTDLRTSEGCTQRGCGTGCSNKSTTGKNCAENVELDFDSPCGAAAWRVEKSDDEEESDYESEEESEFDENAFREHLSVFFDDSLFSAQSSCPVAAVTCSDTSDSNNQSSGSDKQGSSDQSTNTEKPESSNQTTNTDSPASSNQTTNTDSPASSNQMTNTDKPDSSNRSTNTEKPVGVDSITQSTSSDSSECIFQSTECCNVLYQCDSKSSSTSSTDKSTNTSSSSRDSDSTLGFTISDLLTSSTQSSSSSVSETDKNKAAHSNKSDAWEYFTARDSSETLTSSTDDTVIDNHHSASSHTTIETGHLERSNRSAYTDEIVPYQRDDNSVTTNQATNTLSTNQATNTVSTNQATNTDSSNQATNTDSSNQASNTDSSNQATNTLSTNQATNTDRVNWTTNMDDTNQSTRKNKTNIVDLKQQTPADNTILSTIIDKSDSTNQSTITDKADITNQSTITDKVDITNQSTITDKAEITNQSTITDKPNSTNQSTVTDKPDNTNQSTITDKPDSTNQSTITDKPDSTNQYTITDKPDSTNQSTITDKPDSNNQSTITDKPDSTNQSTITDKPDSTNQSTITDIQKMMNESISGTENISQERSTSANVSNRVADSPCQDKSSDIDNLICVDISDDISICTDQTDCTETFCADI